MNTLNRAQYNVAVVGAGPAGLFAARELSENGVHVVLFNRDIKPGGLAEYGIYPTKQRMKDGLRNQFRQILARPAVDYFGNVVIGETADLRLDDLRSLGFHAILITVGAQSTKWLGIPGEEFKGVYHAKDIVYHYNLLPPFSESTYQIGKQVAVVGVGNVMMDITHWLVEDRQVDEVIAVARRGPAEVKFDKKELEIVVNYMDQAKLDEEIKRVTPLMVSIGQDPDQFRKLIADVAAKGQPRLSQTRFLLRFLASPMRILGDSSGRVIGLELEENTMEVNEDGVTRARGTGVRHVLNVDTVIFAIGDLVDGGLGLAVQNGEYQKTTYPRFPVDGASYEAYDPHTGRLIPDIFLAGWARKPSNGLVGVARKDGVNAARAVLQHLQGLRPADESICQRLTMRLNRLSKPVVSKPALLRLEQLERERALELNMVSFKFATNQQMLGALELVK